jgi:hypothetical protein
MSDNLAALVERLEKATDADRKLDAEIHLAVNPHLRTGWSAPNGAGPEGYYARVSPCYTKMVDAALTLLEYGWEYEISTLYGIAHVELPMNDTRISFNITRRQDGNVVLAICTAALRARSVLSNSCSPRTDGRT